MGGAALAAEAFKAGLVDECHLVLAPVLVGGGKHGFPDGVGLELELLQERRFAGGMVFLRYRVVSRVRDPAGNVWWLQTRVEEVSEEENARRMAGERYLDRDARS